MTNTERTAAARKARHLNALRRKAPAMVEALTELGFLVIKPEEAPAARYFLTHGRKGSDDCDLCLYDRHWCACGDDSHGHTCELS